MVYGLLLGVLPDFFRIVTRDNDKQEVGGMI
jgi:hypothetical protein